MTPESRTAADAPRTCGDAGGVTKAGAPCRCALNLSPTSGRCLMHDEGRVAERAAVRAAGGIATRVAIRRAKAADPATVPAPPKTLEDAVRWSSWAMHAVARGELDARTGHEIGYLVNAFKAAVEKRDLLTEIEQLRRDLAAARRETSKPVLSRA